MKTIFARRIRVEVIRQDDDRGESITVRCLDQIDFDDGLHLRIRTIKRDQYGDNLPRRK